LEEEQEQGAETGIDEEAERARSDTLAEETGFETDALAEDWQDDPDKIREDIRDLKRTVERFRKAREEARRHRRTLPL
jgi:50S ribosomal subunit-associated GTPase HflX